MPRVSHSLEAAVRTLHTTGVRCRLTCRSAVIVTDVLTEALSESRCLTPPGMNRATRSANVTTEALRVFRTPFATPGTLLTDAAQDLPALTAFVASVTTDADSFLPI